MRIAMIAVATTLALLVVLGTAASPATATHPDPHGAGFGLAAAEGDALDGRDRALWVGPCDLLGGGTGAGGAGSPPAPRVHCIDSGTAHDCIGCLLGDPGWAQTWAPLEAPAWRLDPVAQAGAHPDISTMFWTNRSPDPHFYGGPQGDGDVKTVRTKLPAGLVVDPNAVPKCGSEHVNSVMNTCPPKTQVGVMSLTLSVDSKGTVTTLHPVYNVEPRDGRTAELLVSAQPKVNFGANVPIVGRARTDNDFGVDGLVTNIPGGLPLMGQTLTLWGVPWASSHDKYRPVAGYRGHDRGGDDPDGGLPFGGLAGGAHIVNGTSISQEPQPYDPSWGEIRPFVANPTECDAAPPVTTVDLDSWQDPGDFKSFSEAADAPIDGCDAVPFDPDLGLAPTSSVADAPTGLSVELALPQNDDPPISLRYEPDDATGAPAHWASADGRATAHLERAVTTLPSGVSLNPSAAAGLLGCSDAQAGLVEQGPPARFSDEDPFDQAGVECPDGSKIGTAAVYTPLLPGDPGEPNLTGEVVLGTPKSTDPQSGDMFRLFLVVRNRQRGLVAKIAGTAVADPATGQLTTVFEQSPRMPFETLSLQLKGGQRGVLALPQRCGAGHAWSALLTPWTAAHGGGGAPVADGGAFPVTSRCGFGFVPSLLAGMDNRQGGGTGTFTFRFARQDGEQWLRSASAKMPVGLVAKLRGVTKCSDAQASAGACPASSRVGTVDAAGGSGSPFFLERKGAVYLTEGYRGAPLGLVVVVPVEAGPFRGALALDDIVVRQALHVDRRSAQVTAVSDPFPLVHHGIPLRMREATLKIDRPDFMVNPTDCSPKQVAATLRSVEGTIATPARPFQAVGCRRLGFKPKLRMALHGRRQMRTGGHPAIRALVRQPVGQAGIERALVRLPKSLALDPANARGLCEFEDGTKPDLEDHCPRRSIVGRARAVSPLLNRPLRGPVFFVKNVRTDPRTGNEIRTLPMIVVALRGEIDVNLSGTSSTTRSGKLVNTFAEVPDAPVSRFALRLKGGRGGILVVTRTRRSEIDICARRQIAVADIDGHNGRRADQRVRIKTPCKRRARARTRTARSNFR
ncbi:MAG: hypothetical protein WD993_08630 [Thermoleophilaceae bacterium]